MTDYLDMTQPFTTTTLLLLPAIGTRRQILVKYGFVNGYLDDRCHEIHYENAVYLLFKPDSFDRFEFHLQRERESQNLLAEYDYDGGYIVLVYQILERFADQYLLFLEGKYSKFSAEYQEAFPKFIRTMDKKTGAMEDQLSLQYQIFNKSEALQNMWSRILQVKFSELGPEMEVWGLPDMEKESLDIDKVRLEIA